MSRTLGIGRLGREHALKTAALMLGSDKSREYCLEMILRNHCRQVLLYGKDLSPA
jgi:hypothetical protein